MSFVPPADLMQDRQFWIQFLNEYQSMPVLWQATNPQFSSRKHRDNALLSLTKIVRTRWPGANVEFIKQRISNFRRTFLNEYEKVEQASKLNNAYMPSLYYYNHLKFLKEHEFDESDSNENVNQPVQSTPKPAGGVQQLTFSAEFIKAQEKRLHNENCSKSEMRTEYEEERPQKRLKIVPVEHKEYKSIIFEEVNYDNSVSTEEVTAENELQTESDFAIVEVTPPSPVYELNSTVKDIHTTEDEFDEIAKRVATHFRKMDPEQSLFAEKLVLDVCVSGRLKRLTAHTSISHS